MKPTALHIERWLSNVEARLVPPPRKILEVTVYEAVEDREKALAELADRYPAFAGRTVKDLNWTDDMAAAQAKALAEHIAAHPEDAGRTVADFKWIVREIVLQPQELIEDAHIAKDTDEDAAVSETAVSETAVSETPDLNVLPPPDPGCLARSKPWRPVHQRPARDMRRPTWKKWER
jgi:hypothetical protein